MNRRSVLQKLVLSSASIPLLGASSATERLTNKLAGNKIVTMDSNKIADEKFWKAFKKKHYSITEEWINLENGYFGVQPDMVCLLYTSPSPRDA